MYIYIYIYIDIICTYIYIYIYIQAGTLHLPNAVTVLPSPRGPRTGRLFFSTAEATEHAEAFGKDRFGCRLRVDMDGYG